MNDIHALLKRMADQGASDLFLTVGAAPHLKINGVTRAIDAPRLQRGEVKSILSSLMTERQRADFEANQEANLSLWAEGVGRFRINGYYQRGDVAMVARLIQERIPTFDELGLPKICADLAMLKRGLVLFVGAAGSGKSTSLAAMIGYRADHADGHILTIEDPIEFLFSHSKALVDQREVAIDTHSFADALRNAMREAPDVIVIGEIRDMETAKSAIAYAETGHLCISTMHANNANQALDRIVNFFPDTAHHQLLMDLSLNLKGVISQRLIPGTQGKQVLATEVMLLNAYTSELIQKARIDELKDAMAKSGELGMHTFDQSLFMLYKSGRISLQSALDNADSRTDLGLRIRLGEQHSLDDVPSLHVNEEPAGRSAGGVH